MNDASQKGTRRLAAILHADVAGFSAQMSADEAGTHAAVARAIARARTTAKRHGGRIVGTAGDAFLAEFPSVVDAVSFAVEFQEHKASGSNRKAGTALKFRIGINLGDVIADGDDIYGEGVNVAARVESLAPPGAIAVTAAVRDQLGKRLDIDLVDGGKHTVKNITDPVHIFTATPPFHREGRARATRSVVPRRRKAWVAVAAGVILAALLGAWLLSSGLVGKLRPDLTSPGSADNRPIVAVLPFSEPGTADTYYGDGFTEDVITNLGRFPELLVLSWNAVAPFRDKAADIDTVRDELNTRYVIGGSIRRSRDRLRVTVQLTDARDGVLLWSRRYETPETELFAIQDKIAGAAAGSLALGVARLEQSAALERPTDKLDAYDLVLRGRAALRRIDRDGNLLARDLFEQALRLDPDYADASAGLAWTYVNEAWWGWSEWPNQAIDNGIRLAREALNIDRDNVSALSALAELNWMQHDLAAAADYCQRAVDINPNDARAHASCGGVLIFSGELEKGIAHAELSLRLDPEPVSWIHTNLGIGYYMTGRFEDAAALVSQAANVPGEDAAPHAVLAAAYARLGRREAARKEVEETLRRSPFFDAEIFAGNLAATGHEQELLEGLREAGFE